MAVRRQKPLQLLKRSGAGSRELALNDVKLEDARYRASKSMAAPLLWRPYLPNLSTVEHVIEGLPTLKPWVEGSITVAVLRSPTLQHGVT